MPTVAFWKRTCAEELCKADPVAFLPVMVEESELDVVPSEKNAESDDAVVGFVDG